MIELVVDNKRPPVGGVLVYRPQEYAFAVEPRPAGTDCSLLVNTVEMLVERGDNRIVCVEGYCPHTGWKRARLVPPMAPCRATLRVKGVEFARGDAVGLNTYPAGLWPVRVDVETGWVCLERPDVYKTDEVDAVQFAAGCVAVLDKGQLVSLWLHPNELPEGI